MSLNTSGAWHQMAHFQERLADDLKDAMRARDERRRDTIRMLTAALKNAQIAAMRPITEAEAEAVLVAQVKQRRDSIESFRAAGREDLAEKEESELALLSAYLPAPPTAEELAAAIQEAISTTGASSLRDMAGVVRIVLDRYPGRVDGKEVAARVRGVLQGAV